MDKEDQNKLPDAFGDLVSSEAYGELTGIDQEFLRKQASIHDAILKIGEADYIRLSTLLLGQLGKLMSPRQTSHAILNDTQTVNTINSIGRLRGITYRFATLSVLKEIKLREVFSKMLQEDDPGKRLELAHEYRDVYGELDTDLKTIEEAEDRLGNVIAEEKKRVDSFLEARKRDYSFQNKFSLKDRAPATDDTETTMGDEWIIIGQIYIDSGNIMVCDPGRFYSDIHPLEETWDKGGYGHQIGEGIAVLALTGLGDGAYNVEALIGEVEGWGERMKEIRVRFIGPGTMYDV